MSRFGYSKDWIIFVVAVVLLLAFLLACKPAEEPKATWRPVPSSDSTFNRTFEIEGEIGEDTPLIEGEAGIYRIETCVTPPAPRRRVCHRFSVHYNGHH